MSSRCRHRWRKAATAMLAMTALTTAPALAWGHAAMVHAELRPAVVVTAHYDSGEPMAQAQITVFAPDDPTRPWLHGLADSDGRFVFVPDAQAGRWSVQVRQAGHGAIAHVVLTEAAASDPGQITAAKGPSRPQALIMAASVVWGCIGTALYFRRRGVQHASG